MDERSPESGSQSLSSLVRSYLANRSLAVRRERRSRTRVLPPDSSSWISHVSDLKPRSYPSEPLDSIETASCASMRACRAAFPALRRRPAVSAMLCGTETRLPPQVDLRRTGNTCPLERFAKTAGAYRFGVGTGEIGTFERPHRHESRRERPLSLDLSRSLE